MHSFKVTINFSLGPFSVFIIRGVMKRAVKSELSFLTGTFLNNYDVINRKL